MFCQQCGQENTNNARFCVGCGAPLQEGAPNAIGPYELRGELGRGAMATVWRAWDPNLEREVAIKEPMFDPRLPQTVLDEMGRRFVAEGRTAAGLNHPNIVTIYAADVWDGRPAIVMELVEGATLAELLKTGPLAPAAALDALDQLLDAVGYAHSHGVVHRDIKPDNVFVDRTGRVKLADFGIARVEDAAATHATVAGAVLGTPGYMSPEQATGAPVDARSDIFSIGVVAYEMFSGHNPFGHGDATTILYRLVHEPVSELPTSASEGLPSDVRPAIMAALAKDPADRPQTAGAFMDMLHGSAVPTRRAGSELGRETTNRRSGPPSWLPYAIVAAVGVVVLAVVIVSATAGSGGGGSASNLDEGALVPIESEQVDAKETEEETKTETKSEAKQKLETVAKSEPKTEPEAEAKTETETKPETDTKPESKPEVEPEAESGPKGEYPPNFPTAYASSEQSAAGYDSASYSPYNVLDNNYSTAWVEAVDGPGIGEWITLSANSNQLVSGVGIVAGFPKTTEIYNENYRPQSITIELSDGYVQTATLADVCGSEQRIDFGGQHATTFVKVTINSAYDTAYWTDNCFAEIRPY